MHQRAGRVKVPGLLNLQGDFEHRLKTIDSNNLYAVLKGDRIWLAFRRDKGWHGLTLDLGSARKSGLLHGS
jgi:hypothetical protein